MTQWESNSSKESRWQQVAGGLPRLKFHVRSTRNKHFPITSSNLPGGPDEAQEQLLEWPAGWGQVTMDVQESQQKEPCKITLDVNKINTRESL